MRDAIALCRSTRRRAHVVRARARERESRRSPRSRRRCTCAPTASSGVTYFDLRSDTADSRDAADRLLARALHATASTGPRRASRRPSTSPPRRSRAATSSATTWALVCAGDDFLRVLHAHHRQPRESHRRLPRALSPAAARAGPGAARRSDKQLTRRVPRIRAAPGRESLAAASGAPWKRASPGWSGAAGGDNGRMNTIGNLVEVRGLHFSYGERAILKGIDLDIPRGKVVAILGTSGSGKTTLLQLIAGSLRPPRGSVTVCGRKVHELDRGSSTSCAGSMGMMFQKGGLFSDLSVFENVAFPIREHTKLPEERDPRPRGDEAARGGTARRAAADARRSSPAAWRAAWRSRARSPSIPTLIIYDEPFAGPRPDHAERGLQPHPHAERRARAPPRWSSPTTCTRRCRLADYLYILGDGVIAATARPRRWSTRPTPSCTSSCTRNRTARCASTFPRARSPSELELAAAPPVHLAPWTDPPAPAPRSRSLPPRLPRGARARRPAASSPTSITEERMRFVTARFADWLGMTRRRRSSGSTLRELYGPEAYAQFAPWMKRALPARTCTTSARRRTPTAPRLDLGEPAARTATRRASVVGHLLVRARGERAQAHPRRARPRARGDRHAHGEHAARGGGVVRGAAREALVAAGRGDLRLDARRGARPQADASSGWCTRTRSRTCGDSRRELVEGRAQRNRMLPQRDPRRPRDLVRVVQLGVLRRERQARLDPVARAGRHRARGRRGAAAPGGGARRAHRAAEPQLARRAPRARDPAREPQRRPAGAALHRPRPLQEGERHRSATPPATRCCARPPRASAPACARSTPWRAWAATSSWCCSRPTCGRTRRASSASASAPRSARRSTGRAPRCAAARAWA